MSISKFNKTENMAMLLSLNDAANLLSLSIWTLRAWAQMGKIKTVKLGRRRMIHTEEVNRIVQMGVS